jgi:hypothetical protein
MTLSVRPLRPTPGAAMVVQREQSEGLRRRGAVAHQPPWARLLAGHPTATETSEPPELVAEAAEPGYDGHGGNGGEPRNTNEGPPRGASLDRVAS